MPKLALRFDVVKGSQQSVPARRNCAHGEDCGLSKWHQQDHLPEAASVLRGLWAILEQSYRFLALYYFCFVTFIRQVFDELARVISIKMDTEVELFALYRCHAMYGNYFQPMLFDAV